MKQSSSLALCILILAFQYFFMKDGLAYASPAALEAVICLLMTLILLGVTRFGVDLDRATLTFSLFFWLSGAFWVFGLGYVSPPVSAVLGFTMPLFCVPLSMLLLRERNSRVEVAGASVGFMGVVLFNVAFISDGSTSLGIGLCLANGFFWALFSVYSKRLAKRDPLRTLCTASLFSTIGYFALLLLPGFQFRFSEDLVVDVAYMAVAAGALNAYLWISLLRRERVSKITTVAFAAPVITLAYSAAASRAIPSFYELGGVTLIFLGIYLSNMLTPGRGAGLSIPAQVPTQDRED